MPVPVSAAAHDGYFATPTELAAEIIEHHTMIADLPHGVRVLETSADDGAIVRAILAVNPTLNLTAIAPHPIRARMLDDDSRVIVARTTLEEFCAVLPRPEPFDAVVMNLLFVLDDQPTAWISQVLAAWGLLAPGGRLVAVVPGEFTYRRDEDHDALRELITLHGGSRQLPDTALTGTGPGIRAVVIIADRPGIPPDHLCRRSGGVVARGIATAAGARGGQSASG